MKTRIIVDSTSDLLPHLRDQVEVIPLIVRFGEEEFLDGIEIDHETFYHRLIEKKEIATTSQPSPAECENYFAGVQESGDEAVMISLASKLSGTCQSLILAAQDFENVHVVDSGTVTIGASILVEYALRLRDQGLRAAQIVEKLEEKKKQVIIVAVVDTLEYLMRGGRLSKTAAWTGTLLNIKPVISFEDGEIKILGKARGLKRASVMMTEQIDEKGGIDFDMPVIWGYSGLSDEAIQRYLEESRSVWEGKVENPQYTSIGTVIGAHVGPGAYAIAYFRKG